MSSLYNKEYINTCDQSIFKNLIENNTKVDFTALFKRIEIVVLQHYIIKYIEENGKTNSINNMLSQFYSTFQKYPYLFVDSPLLKEGFLNRFMTEKERKIIMNTCNNYFNNEKCRKLYAKYKKSDLTDSEKNQLFSFLIHKSDNSQYDEVIDFCSRKILNSNKKIKDLNTMELKLYCTYIAKLAGKMGQIKPEVHIMSNKPENGGFQINGLIFLNKYSSYITTLEEITKTTCHETEHAIQYKDLKNKSTRKAFEMAYFELFEKYLSNEDYKAYDLNYKYSEIELDAEKFGFFYGQTFLLMLGRKDLADKLKPIKKDSFDKRHYYQSMYDKNKEQVPIDTFIVRNLDEIIKKHPEELKNYKVLNNIYDINGERKSFSTLLSNLMNQDFESRGIYDNYINYEILNDRLDTLSLKVTGKNAKQKVFKALRDVYKDKEILFKDYCTDKDYNHTTSDQIMKTTVYQLSIIDKIITYVDKNFEHVLEAKEDGLLTNSSFIYEFIYGLQDYKLTNINNKVIQNDQIINEKYKELQEKISSIIAKFNKQFILDRIVDIPIENLNEKIKIAEGKEITVEDYFLKVILPNMNGHLEYRVNGREKYVGDIITEYKNYLKNQNNKSLENHSFK